MIRAQNETFVLCADATQYVYEARKEDNLMINKILRALASAIDTAFAFLRLPFQYIFGGLFTSDMPPAFTPTESTSSLADRLTDEAKNEINFKKDCVDVLNRYCAAAGSTRDTIDLSVFKPEVRELLLNIDDHELNLLKNSPLKARRVFIDGGDHGIEGLPTVEASTKICEDNNVKNVATIEDMKSRLQAYAKSPSPSY